MNWVYLERQRHGCAAAKIIPDKEGGRSAPPIKPEAQRRLALVLAVLGLVLIGQHLPGERSKASTIARTAW